MPWHDQAYREEVLVADKRGDLAHALHDVGHQLVCQLRRVDGSRAQHSEGLRVRGGGGGEGSGVSSFQGNSTPRLKFFARRGDQGK